MLILGIDTSCDDTAAGVVLDGLTVCSNVIASQHAAHGRFGGIVPMIAAREHTSRILFIVDQALSEAGVDFHDLDAVAVTHHQGLLLSLVVGVSAAKSIALACNIPFIGVHHLEGHIYSNVMAHEATLRWPFLCLTVAGGHTLLLLVEAHGRYRLLGHTRDDAAGEVFDKVARRLGLGYPGGPAIERLAAQGNPNAYAFPRPLLHERNAEFSFSGLKSAVMQTIDRASDLDLPDLCASFQQAVIDVLVTKTLRVAQARVLDQVALAGGVALNRPLRSALESAASTRGIELLVPPQSLCMDNGAMIAGAGHFLYQTRGADPLTIDATANAPLGRTEHSLPAS